MNCIDQTMAGGMGYGMAALEQSVAFAKGGMIALVIAAPFAGVAGVTYLALNILGAPAVIIYGGAAIPAALAAPGLVIGSILLVAATFFASTGLAALSVSLPLVILTL